VQVKGDCERDSIYFYCLPKLIYMSTTKESYGAWKLEEQYVLRVRNPEVADRIREALRGSDGSTDKNIELIFDGRYLLLNISFAEQKLPRKR